MLNKQIYTCSECLYDKQFQQYSVDGYIYRVFQEKEYLFKALLNNCRQYHSELPQRHLLAGYNGRQEFSVLQETIFERYLYQEPF